MDRDPRTPTDLEDERTDEPEWEEEGHPDDARPITAADEAFWDAPPPVEPDRPGVLRLALAWFIAALLGAGVGGAAVYYVINERTPTGRNVVVNVADSPVDTSLPSSENAAARVADAVLPSIVQVQVDSGLGQGLGSGVIYTSDGYILTNDHVIEGARDIVVNLPDGNQLDAAVVGSARSAGVDIALLKVVTDEPMTAAVFGSSADLDVGELAVAIGSPFGLDATVTAGIISALHRNPSDSGVPIIDAIQTDAAINQGNSGGALANSRGEVVGINTAILGGAAGGNVGVGFAIPIDIARKVADQIIENGSAQLAFLGVQGDSLPGDEGARVRDLTAGGPAEEAGIRPGDVIVEVDGDEVTSMEGLISLLLTKDVGQRVSVVLEREGERSTVTATLTSRPQG